MTARPTFKGKPITKTRALADLRESRRYSLWAVNSLKFNDLDAAIRCMDWAAQSAVDAHTVLTLIRDKKRS